MGNAEASVARATWAPARAVKSRLRTGPYAAVAAGRGLLLCAVLLCLAGNALAQERHVFFLHNRFLETHGLDEMHPEYGRAEYPEILARLRAAGLTVHSEQRQGEVRARDYARQISAQIRELLAAGVAAQHITVVGTSKGGYIAQYVSTYLHQPQLNVVLVGSYQDSDLTNYPEINFCGRILNIYEASDSFGVSAQGRAKASDCDMSGFRELELNTGLRHGFLFRALPAWLDPTIAWAQQADIPPVEQAQ